MEELNFIEAMGRFREDLRNELQPKLDELKKSVSEGKSAIASTLTQNGVSTAQDATFETISTNINTLAENKYDAGVAATQKGTATPDKVLEGYTFTSAAAGVEIEGTMKGGLGGNASVNLPTCLKSLNANGGNKFVTLTLEYSNTDYVSGVQVNYKTEDYPDSPFDGESVAVTGAQTSIKTEGLTNGTLYYFRVFLYNDEVDGVKYYQTDITNAKVTCMPGKVSIVGITPLVVGKDHIVIVESGNGTISAPKGTTIILGSGADPTESTEKNTGGSGGFVKKVTLPDDVMDASVSITISSSRASSSTSIKIEDTTYDCGSSATVISSKWGPIGGNGGNGARYNEDSDKATDITPSTGAGGGGGGLWISASNVLYTGIGGNANKYGNYGGNGGVVNAKGTPRNAPGEKGSSGSGGSTASYCSGGGGGGYAAGGGGGAMHYDDSNSNDACCGTGGTGIIVIQWDE